MRLRGLFLRGSKLIFCHCILNHPFLFQVLSQIHIIWSHQIPVYTYSRVPRGKAGVCGVSFDSSSFLGIYFLHAWILNDWLRYYRENRRLQALLVLKERGTIADTEPYFHQIAGFFIVENNVLDTTSLVPRAVVESLWDFAVAKMKVYHFRSPRPFFCLISLFQAVLQEQFAYVQSPELLTKVKVFVFCFASTLRSYSYDISWTF